jgi:hypothetical protein
MYLLMQSRIGESTPWLSTCETTSRPTSLLQTANTNASWPHTRWVFWSVTWTTKLLPPTQKSQLHPMPIWLPQNSSIVGHTAWARIKNMPARPARSVQRATALRPPPATWWEAATQSTITTANEQSSSSTKCLQPKNWGEESLLILSLY